MSLGLGALAFVLTLAEAGIGARFTRAVAARRIRSAVSYGMLFELLLCVDVWLLDGDNYWMAVPIVLGAGLGIWIGLRDPRHA